MIRDSLKYLIPIWFIVLFLVGFTFTFILDPNSIDTLMLSSYFYLPILIISLFMWFWSLYDSNKRFENTKKKNIWFFFIFFTYIIGVTVYYYKYGKNSLR